MKRIYTISLAVLCLQLFSGCAVSKTHTYEAKTVAEKPSGIYVGAMSYGSSFRNITGDKPVFLNEEGGSFLMRAIINRYKIEGGSASLQKAVEQAVQNINRQYGYSSYAYNAESVNIVIISGNPSNASAFSALPKMRALGKDANVHFIQAGEETELGKIPAAVSNVASKLTVSHNGSSIVYIILDAAPSSETAAVLNQYAAVALLDVLSEKVNIETPTPLSKILIDESKYKVSSEVDWDKTGDYWLAGGITVGVLGLLALLIALAVEAGAGGEDCVDCY
jgi:hypothetical protein